MEAVSALLPVRCLASKFEGTSMTFPQTIRDEAYTRSQGRCECVRPHTDVFGAPHHGGHCTAKFASSDQWHAGYKVATKTGGLDTVANCEVLCMPCQELID